MSASQRKRGRGSKVKTGCMTWIYYSKKRRVKCDENKPACAKCQHMKLECGGYLPKKTQAKHMHRLVPLLSKCHTTSNIVASVTPNLAYNSFTSTQEYRYFRVFCDTTASNLGEYFDGPLWNHIVLQATEQESFIKHAVVALGALNKTLEATTVVRGSFGSGGASSTEHYQVAIQQYSKSIRGIRKACDEERRSYRTILIACLLAICFEYFYGNVDLAIAHVLNGINLIEEWFLSVRQFARPHEQHKDFLPGIIEDELISIFTRIGSDLHSWHEAQHNISEMKPELQKVAKAIIHAIPGQGFENLHSARKYFDILMQRVDELVNMSEMELWRVSSTAWKPILVENRASILASREDQATTCKEGLIRWFKAFKPLRGKFLKSGGNDIIVANALLLRYTCSSVALNCCCGPELAYDVYTAEYREGLSLAETLLAAIKFKTRPTFVISSVLIRSLYFIALKCRNRSIRREAIACLRSMSRREGIWDSKVACTVAIAIMELEEAGGDDFVPDHKRLRAVKVSFDLHKCEGKLRYLKLETEPGPTRFVSQERRFSAFEWEIDQKSKIVASQDNVFIVWHP